MFFGSNKILGLDIGSSSIKMVEIDVPKAGSPKLISFAVLPTPVGAVSSGEILDTASVSQTIRELYRKLGSKRKSVAVGLWGNAVIVKKINLASMDSGLIEEQIQWEAEQYIPYDVADINLEYHVIKSRTAAPETMDVLLVAARKDIIFNYVEAIEQAEIQCSILDVSGFALSNCFILNTGEHPGEVYALLDIGASSTNFVVIDGGDVVFSRDIPVGGGNYTSEIQRVLSITAEEAEGMKLDAARNRQVPVEVNDIISSQHEIITEEIKKSIEFYSATSSEFPIQKMLLTGGGSQTPGLKDFIHQSTQLRVDFFNALSAFQIDSRKFSHEFIAQITPLCSVAIGLGLRKLGDR